MVRELGPDYFPFAIDVLRSACPPKGFTAHVLGFTLHALLEGLAKGGVPPGALDASLPLILPFVEADVFGGASEAKEVEAFAKNYKEAKRCRAFEAYQLLAGMVTFRSQVGALLAPVRARLGEASSPRVRAKLAQLLQAAARGALANPTTTPEALCQFFYATADAGLAAEEASRARAGAASGAAVRTGAGAAGESAADSAALHQHLLVEFALLLLAGGLKRGRVLSAKDPAAAPLLDPLLPLLVRALR